MSYKYYYKRKKFTSNTANQQTATTTSTATTTTTTTSNNCNQSKSFQREFLNLTETILEGQYISCYLINSEPRLCLSQILSKVLIHFPIEQIRDKFYELGIYCRPCTPTQLQVLKNRCLLPCWVNLCGLVTKSDAERLCLDLFNTVIPKRRLDYELILQPRNLYAHHLHKSSYFHNDERNHDACIQMFLSLRPADQPIKTNLIVADQDEPINYIMKRKLFDSDSHGDIKTTSRTYQCLSAKALTSTSIKRGYTLGPSLPENDYTKLTNFLLGIDRHRELNCLVNSAPTLILSIKVYHRCIGKCTGLYYPALYYSPNSQVIECIKCHYLFSPRRFIGHTHGSKESRVCHWGLNSHDWRYYIHLSKTQPTNNLEEREVVKIYCDLRSRFNYTEFYDGPARNTGNYSSQPDFFKAGRSTDHSYYDQSKSYEKATTRSLCSSEENFCDIKRLKLSDSERSTSGSSSMGDSLRSSHIPLSHNVMNFNTCQDISLLSDLEKILTRNGARLDLKQEIIEEALRVMNKVRRTELLNNQVSNLASLSYPSHQT